MKDAFVKRKLFVLEKLMAYVNAMVNGGPAMKEDDVKQVVKKPVGTGNVAFPPTVTVDEKAKVKKEK